MAVSGSPPSFKPAYFSSMPVMSTPALVLMGIEVREGSPPPVEDSPAANNVDGLEDA